MDRALPPVFVPERASDYLYDPDPAAVAGAAREWSRAHGLVPAAEDGKRTLFLLVDLQKDFCFPEGSLFVGGTSGRGAIEDNRRVATFLYRNLAAVSATLATLDSHQPHHIFSPSFWIGADGEPVEAHRVVSAEEVRHGRLLPQRELASWVAGGDYEWLRRQALDYCEELERRGRYQLYLWPSHCLMGSRGHSMVGVVQEARLFHAYARRAEADIEIKGTSVLTEHYSVLGPEIATAHDGTPLVHGVFTMAEKLMQADRLIIAGQASSHCVRNTLEDLLRWIAERDSARGSEAKREARALARKVYVLEDCMSAVAVPDPDRPGKFLADFTASAQATLDRCREAGMHVVRSTVPVEEWPARDEKVV